MLGTLTISGYSDDLIEIGGDIEEEVNYLQFDNADDGKGALVAFADGTVLRIVFSDDGPWRITPVARGTAELQVDQVPEKADDGTDVATLTGEIRWVVCGNTFLPNKNL